MKRVLASLDRRWLTAASSNLSSQLGKLVDSGIGREVEHVLAFTSAFPGEVDLTSFVGFQMERRKVYLPFIDQNDKLTFVKISGNWLENLQTGPHGILQPTWSAENEYQAVEAESTVVIVPGLAFDRDGNRLSRDRGQYDIFMARPQLHAALKIGVGWSLQLVDEVPSESHHIMMDWLCHERGVICSTKRFDEDVSFT